MANLDCSACEEIRQLDPNFVVNGFGDEECASLQNDTGLVASSGHDDFTDLNLLNDCLVGNMETVINSYDVCDWKAYMKKFVPNVWTTLKAIICAIGGLWTNIHKIWCTLDYLMTGASFTFTEHSTEGESKLVPGKGVDFSIRSTGDQHASDVTITYLGGALGVVHGSLITFINSFTDAYGQTRSGNSAWDFSSSNFSLPNGGELLYEIRIKKSEYPELKSIHNGQAWNTGGGQRFFQCMILNFDGDNVPEDSDARYAYGQHGWCDRDGTPSSEGYDRGHAVPSGWLYVQIRMLYVASLGVGDRTDGAGATKRGSAFSPRGFVGIRLNQDEIEC